MPDGTGEDPDHDKKRPKRKRPRLPRRIRVLLWRVAIGAATGLGTVAVTVGVPWIMAH